MRIFMQNLCKYMKAPTLYFYLDKRTTAKSGGHPVKLVAYYKSKQAPISVGYYFTEEQWAIVQDRSIKRNKQFDSSKDTSDSDAVLSKIRKELDVCMEKASNAITYLTKRGVPFQAIDIKTEYERDHRSDDELMSFYNCYHVYVQSRIYKGASPSTIASFKSMYSVLSEYYHGLSKRNNIETLRMVQIDVKFLRDLESYLKNVRHNSEGTVGAYFRNIRALFNYAISKGVLPREAYPFGKRDEGVKVHTVKKTKKALTKKELLTFIAYRPKLIKTQVRNFDLSLLSFLLHGANMIDIAQLTYGRNYSENENTITFMREKTYKSKEVIVPVEVKITKEIKFLMDLYGNENKPENYIFKIIDPKSETPVYKQVNNQVRAIDKTLKRVAKKCGIREDLSYQFFRHTHATLALKEAGANIYDLMTSMGHSSIKTTQAYINSLPDEDNKIGKMKSDLMVGVYE